MLMATIGIAYVLDGVGQLTFGSDIYKIDVGMPKEPLLMLQNVFDGGLLVSREDVAAAGLAVLLVATLTTFFRKTRPGLALRAVADDQKASLSIGIPLQRMWLLAWSIAGVVALCAGIVWGSKLGVQFSLAQIALKALPAVILGGLTSIPGAIVGSLVIGVGEKLSEAFLGPLVGGGIESWFGYVLALAVLLIRPQGLLGQKALIRV
jgi:branched-chain amino acid transport system permease protein